MPDRYCTQCKTVIPATAYRQHQREHAEQRKRRPGSTSQWRIIRARILERDRHACQVCGQTTRLEVHHLDGDWRNNHHSNLETRCTTHNPRGHPPAGDTPPRRSIARAA